MSLLRIFAVAVMCTALIAPAASAQTPAKTGYDETGVLPQLPPKKDLVPPPQGGILGENEQGGTDDEIPPPGKTGTAPGSGDAPTPRTDTPTERREVGAPPVKSGTLPFTGLDVGIVALLGLLLLGTGFALRRTRSTRAN